MTKVRDKRVLAPLLVLVLLICHGAYGTAVHNLMFEEGVAAEGHASHGEVPAGEGQGSADEGAVAVGYAAGLLVVMTAVFWLRFGNGLTRRGVPILDPLRRRLAPSVLRYPHGPDFPFLQVFRL